METSPALTTTQLCLSAVSGEQGLLGLSACRWPAGMHCYTAPIHLPRVTRAPCALLLPAADADVVFSREINTDMLIGHMRLWSDAATDPWTPRASTREMLVDLRDQ